MNLPIYIDIDGTLTDCPNAGGRPIEERIEAIRQIIDSGQQAVVIWSGGGTDYATQFAKNHGLTGAICIGKPSMIVDDNPDIRPRDRMRVLSPGAYFG